MLFVDSGVKVVAGDGQRGMVDGPALSARFHRPQSILIAGTTIHVSDYSSDCIRVIQRSTFGLDRV